ncbi:DMT family transporter [Desulfovibrio oxyclinae]|uniref:DMT family transporter n=1 Tax=Desulfovibrio oxyclinae TaxID=63560 RepID=UPI00035F3E90|nr:EamA family transporter [Desulfovibrio oxyclinae]
MDIRGCFYILAAASMWGLIGVFTKFLLAEDISAMEIAFWRANFGWLCFLAHAKYRRIVRVSYRDLPVLLSFGFVCVTMFYVSYQLAIRDVGMALAAVLLYTAPAWVAFLSRVILKEPLGAIKLTCVVMTIAGVACISLGPKLLGGSTIPLDLFGLAAGLTAGLTYALYYIFGKKWLHRYSTPTIFTYALPFGSLILLPFVDFAPKSSTAWLLLVGIGMICSYGAFSAYYAGLRRMEATNAAVIATFEPVLAAVLAFVLFGEQFGIFGYAGSALIMAALLMVVIDQKTRRNKECPNSDR